MAAKLAFNWNYAPETTHPHVEFTLYEDGKPIQPHIGVMNFSLLMDGKPSKSYVYYVTTVDTDTGLESDPSPSVTVNFTKPAAPTNFKGLLTQ